MDPIAPGRRFGGYQLDALIGSGATGDVYRARDLELGREVAVKVLSRPSSIEPARRQRVGREARLLASLNHPNIAAIYDTVDIGDTYGLVLEFVSGETLTDRLTRKGRPILPTEMQEALGLAGQVMDALEASHTAGIVHRDLKPANIKITPNGTVKVLDFGIAEPHVNRPAGDVATLTRGSTLELAIVGTLPYMSPEQLRGQTGDQRTDVWAFGCVLYEMLTAQRAFPEELFTDVIASILQREPGWGLLPASTPVRVKRLLKECLSKDPAGRPVTIGDVRRRINGPEPPPPPVVTPQVRTRLKTAAYCLASALAGSIATVWLLW
jgi:eukaryotic-like serine/threonine-protein kinase